MTNTEQEQTEQEQDETVRAQAAELELLLPRLMRRLFSLERDHPATELPLAQLRVCSILLSGPRTLSAISEELGISVSAATQIADRLEKAALVERISGQDDRRTKKLQLSAHGRDMMHSRREQRTLRAASVLQQLPAGQRESALQVVRALLAAANAITPSPPREDPTGIRQEQ